jgi:hypothetical protein
LRKFSYFHGKIDQTTAAKEGIQRWFYLECYLSGWGELKGKQVMEKYFEILPIFWNFTYDDRRLEIEIFRMWIFFNQQGWIWKNEKE